MPAWLHANADMLLLAAAGAFLVLLLVAAMFFTWIPADYFRTPRRPPPRGPRWLRILRNILGALVLAVGLVLFLLPGPGSLVILLGLMLTDLPGKHRLLRWTLTRRWMFATVSALRRRVAKSPLIIDAPPAPTPRSPARPPA